MKYMAIVKLIVIKCCAFGQRVAPSQAKFIGLNKTADLLTSAIPADNSLGAENHPDNRIYGSCASCLIAFY